MARKLNDEENEWGNDSRDGKRNRFSDKENHRRIRKNIERNRNDYFFKMEDEDK